MSGTMPWKVRKEWCSKSTATSVIPCRPSYNCFKVDSSFTIVHPWDISLADSGSGQGRTHAGALRWACKYSNREISASKGWQFALDCSENTSLRSHGLCSNGTSLELFGTWFAWCLKYGDSYMYKSDTCDEINETILRYMQATQDELETHNIFNLGFGSFDHLHQIFFFEVLLRHVRICGNVRLGLLVCFELKNDNNDIYNKGKRNNQTSAHLFKKVVNRLWYIGVMVINICITIIEGTPLCGEKSEKKNKKKKKK